MQLTDDEWWMTRLCALRNAMVRDDEVPDNLLLHDGQHQLNHIHDRLIAALKRVASELADDPLLRLSRSDRVFRRRQDEMIELLETKQEPETT